MSDRDADERAKELGGKLVCREVAGGAWIGRKVASGKTKSEAVELFEIGAVKNFDRRNS